MSKQKNKKSSKAVKKEKVTIDDLLLRPVEYATIICCNFSDDMKSVEISAKLSNSDAFTTGNFNKQQVEEMANYLWRIVGAMS